MSRARSNRRRRPFDGDLCHCGRRWQLVPNGSTRSLGAFNVAGLDTDYQPSCWHPDEHPGHRAVTVTPAEFVLDRGLTGPHPTDRTPIDYRGHGG